MSFEEHIEVANKGTSDDAIFALYSTAVSTQRDAWCYNYSTVTVENNCKRTLKYLEQLIDEKTEHDDAWQTELERDDKISWSRRLKAAYERNTKLKYADHAIVQSLYRPFTKQYLYFDKTLSEELGKTKRIFDDAGRGKRNIAISGFGTAGFSALMLDIVPCYDMISKAKLLPLKLYEEQDKDAADLFAGDGANNGYAVKDGITDYGLKHFRDAYGNASITKEDIFYYTYGLLHSEEYRTRYADNLSKQLPRIPAVKQEADFWAFVVAGRKLGDLHVNYETAELYPVTIAEGDLRLANIADPVSFYRVEQMRYAGKRGSDKTTLHYNNNITLTDIPLAAYDYVVNGKAALDWVVERQRVKTDAKSGIVNDANDYANETMHNPAYPLELFQRVITVSLETMQIVRNLPKLEIKEQ